MNSPALSIAYSLWLRLRWGIASVVVLLLIVAALVQLFPDAAQICCMVGMMLVFMALALLLNTFTFGPADLGVRTSGFPTHMMVLPLSNRALVGWPILFGAATNATLWALLSGLICIPAGLSMPVVWPAALLAAVCAWVQAIGWSPFPSPFARVPALVIALAPLIAPPALGASVLDDRSLAGLVAVSSLSWTVAAYVFGIHGLARARRGNEADWFRYFVEHRTARAREHVATGKQARPAFRSAFAAQLWHECRRNAVSLPMIFSFAALPMFPVLCLAVLNPDSNRDLMFGSTQLTPTQLTLAVWFIVPLVLSGTFGPGMAKFDFFGGKSQ